MGKPNLSDEFKRDAVARIIERGHPVAEVSQRLGVSPHSLYGWKRQLAKVVSGDASKDAEVRELKSAGAGDRGARHPKQSHCVFRSRCKTRYAFIAPSIAIVLACGQCAAPVLCAGRQGGRC